MSNKIIFDTYGILIEGEKFRIRFGNNQLTDVTLDPRIAGARIARIKQVHGDLCVEAESSQLLEADAHWTRVDGVALIIKTADCMPIYVVDSKRGTILGIHAGWRGVENQITLKSVKQLLGRGSLAKDLALIVGPHIQQNSFEVGDDVATKLFNCMGMKIVKQEEFSYKLYGKQYLDLSKILIAQLQALEIRPEQIHFLKIDTKTNLHFHSYRRDKENSGRNISWGQLLNQ